MNRRDSTFRTNMRSGSVPGYALLATCRVEPLAERTADIQMEDVDSPAPPAEILPGSVYLPRFRFGSCRRPCHQR